MSSRLSVRSAILCSLLALVVGITLGLLIGYLLSVQVADPGHKHQVDLLRHLVRDGWSDDPNVTQKIIDSIDPERIRENLKFLSEEPHLAGTERDIKLAEAIRDKWKEYGLDHIEMVPYEVLLSFPDPKKPNTVQLIGSHGKILFNASAFETPLTPSDKQGKYISAYHAYSPSKTVEGELVYLNEGTDNDLDVVEALDIPIEGKIAIVREGGAPLGEKLLSLHSRGVIGVITYPDPAEVAQIGTDPKDVYPHTKWLPSSGIVRSSAALEKGDPQTPGYPSIKEAYRTPLENVPLPPIPSQPIGYGDALVLLASMSGDDAPEIWEGALNVRYRMGPGFANKTVKKVRLTVNNRYINTTVFNIIATVKGNIEPDRYVILGNHRDGWGFGAIDPSSGTAMMLELTRVFGKLLREGWRPRRTMVFCSWAAEEFALIGSTEWVEEKLPKLNERAVAYINSDVCAVGPHLEVMASPILYDAVYHVTRLIPDPEGKEKNLYEAWLKNAIAENENGDKTNEPKFKALGPYSDFGAFIYTAGIPVMDFTFQLPKDQLSSTVYPSYHTGYDTFHVIDRFVDPTFTRHRGCGQLAGLMMRYLADASVLPLNVRRLTVAMKKEADELNSTGFMPDIQMSNLNEKVKRFLDAADIWYERFSIMDKQNPMSVRMFNDQMMNVEKAFTYLPLRDFTQYFTRHRGYLEGASIYEAVTLFYQTGDESYTHEIGQHLSDLAIAIHQATDVLKPFSSV